MKKNSGGYVLVYVLIVIVLLSLLALGVCSIALRNLQTQQASVEQMQERYEVEGNMERFVAKLQELQVEDSIYYSAEDTAHSEARSRFWTEVRGMANGIVTLQGDAPAWEVDDSCKLTVQAVLGDQVLTAVLDVSVSISITPQWIPTPTEDTLQFTVSPADANPQDGEEDKVEVEVETPTEAITVTITEDSITVNPTEIKTTKGDRLNYTRSAPAGWTFGTCTVTNSNEDVFSVTFTKTRGVLLAVEQLVSTTNTEYSPIGTATLTVTMTNNTTGAEKTLTTTISLKALN